VPSLVTLEADFLWQKDRSKSGWPSISGYLANDSTLLITSLSVNASRAPMQPYAVGTMHVVMKGKLEDGTSWQASADYAPAP
jgi:hypothetical protein